MMSILSCPLAICSVSSLEKSRDYLLWFIVEQFCKMLLLRGQSNFPCLNIFQCKAFSKADGKETKDEVKVEMR